MARSKDPRTDEACRAANHMDHAAASEVVKALALVIGVAQPASAPSPAHNHRVNQASHDA